MNVSIKNRTDFVMVVHLSVTSFYIVTENYNSVPYSACGTSHESSRRGVRKYIGNVVHYSYNRQSDSTFAE